jgi:hypothetical protein
MKAGAKDRCRTGIGLLGVLSLFVLSCVIGCSSVPVVGKQGRATAFGTAVTNYSKMLRWGYFEEATGYLRARDGETVPPDLTQLARHRITSYSVKSQLLADNGREGRVLALIEYYDVDSGVLKSLRDEQLWWFDDETKRWYLSSTLPGFGASAE